MDSPRNVHELRTWLARKLRMKEDSNRFGILWATLEERPYYYVEEWEMGTISDDEFLEEAERVAGRFRNWEERSYERKGRTVQDMLVEPTESERAATDALRAYLAAHANKQSLVQRFRKEYLPHGRLLTRDEDIAEFLAVKLGVEPDLKKYLDSRQGKPGSEFPFKLQAVPFERDRPALTYGDVVRIFAEEDGIYTHEDIAQMFAKEGDIYTYEDVARVLAEDGVYTYEDTVQTIIDNTAGSFSDEDVAEILAEEERKEEKQIEEDWEEGPAWWHLEELGEWLTDKYPWENVGDAAVFLISGRPPRLAEPLSATLDMSNATYSITFRPWVSEKTVLRAYRAVTRRPYRAAYRLPGDKTIRVLRFVVEQADEEGHLPTWEVMHDRWNVANPGEKFWDRSAFNKTYYRAVAALVPPYLPLT